VFFHVTDIRTLKNIALAILLGQLSLSGMAGEYVGRISCSICHQEQNQRWLGSQHDLAMQEATPETVLGDFEDSRFRLHGLTSRFFRKGNDFWVNTDGPDNKLHDYRIKYTFGIYPLQQYLVEFPGGRLQVLDIAWDSRSAAEGGQRWFHLHPASAMPAGDVLHWTGPNLNWNYMCADCHSTNLKKNYDQTSHSYNSSWSEIDVSCEACHGPGSEHVAWAKTSRQNQDQQFVRKGLSILLDERRNVHWATDRLTGKPVPSRINVQHKELEVCAHCHARREQLHDTFIPGQPFMDTYRPALLGQGLYHADGQIRDEVYIWGSFLQSRMYQAGVTCSDCHDPHTTQLRVSGDQVCRQCHSPQRYAQQSHHHHKPESAGASCVECHMPARTYMEVDRRHDHGFRIPRPDLSISTGSPNACNQCHNDKDAAWARTQVESWYGKQTGGLQKFAIALDAARRLKPGATAALLQLVQDKTQPAVSRATALSQLGGVIDQTTITAIQQNLQSANPLLRMAALNALEHTPGQIRLLATPLVRDKIRTIRIQAARMLAGFNIRELEPARQEILDAALQEYIQAQEFNAERPEAQLNLGALYADLDQPEKAETAYRSALQLQPGFVPARVQYSRFLETRGRHQAAERLLLAGLGELPDSAELQHALGLFLLRTQQPDAALPPLGKAAELAPQNARYAYVLAVALQDLGKTKEALKVLERSLASHPHDTDLLIALIHFNRESGKREMALQWAKQLQALLPDSPGAEELLHSLERNE
jgi:predicted CXXCH cytochrome family protein